ncbi:shiftless antiviral inhibitor of ribosomal frameshifting protein homolog isoform X2 [Amphiura filiformis]|uniref:shiftless antiviral inhibitor of ribosomal frameshifting protein homolog isoform X2 n=1 Tax=Amphiura filiformis TaxID=82378 RepID=UPI003B2202E5
MAGEVPADFERSFYIPSERLSDKFADNTRDTGRNRIEAICKAITTEASNGVTLDFAVMANGTVRFTLRGTQDTVQVGVGLLERRLTTERKQETRSLPDGITALTVENLRRHNQHLVEQRQFACQPCQKVWWRKVFSYKEVSKCARCHVRYDAIQKDREYGWGRYVCPNCGHVFWGRAKAGVPAPCHQCSTMVLPAHIGPLPISPTQVLPAHIGPVPRDSNVFRRTNYRHACARCDNGRIRPCPSFALLQVTSMVHQSTGSTVSTFLTQRSDASTYFEPTDT